MKFGDLTYEEIRDCAKKGWLAIVPTGCTEQQGSHLPVDFDTWFAEKVCVAASEKLEKDFGIDSLVLPAMPFGPTPEHKNYGSGYIDIPRDLHESLLACILKSLAEQGFQRIVVWRGCGQHDFIDTVKRFNIDNNGKPAAYLPALPYHDIWCRIGNPDIPGGHADSFSTSIALNLRPDAVRTEKIVDPQSSEVDWGDPDLDFAKYSKTGVIGDPTYSSAELGRKLWEAVVKEAAHIFNEIAQGRQSSKPVDSDKLHFLRRKP
jgi:creatinine amidohydrolase